MFDSEIIRRGVMEWGHVGPAGPESFSSAGREAWERVYPQFLARYYALCERHLESVSPSGVSESGGYDRIPRIRADWGGFVGVCEPGSGDGLVGERASALLGDAGRVEVGVQGVSAVEGGLCVDGSAGGRSGGCSRFGSGSGVGRVEEVMFGDVCFGDVGARGAGRVTTCEARGARRGWYFGSDLSDAVRVWGVSSDGTQEGESAGFADSLLAGGQGRAVHCGTSDGGNEERTQGKEGREGFGQGKVRGVKKNKPGKKMRERLARQEVRRLGGSGRSDWRKKEEDGEKGVLRTSLEAKWAAENELAVEKAKQRLAVLRAVDVDQVAKVQETRRKKAIEANMVAMEKSHAFLKATGNVPGEVGFCQTVVSDDGIPGLSSGSGSPVCTISPDSSASMKDFRACQKKLLDSEAQVERLTGVLEKYGLLRVGEVGVKKAYTVGENGELPESVLNEVFPDGYIGEILADGKYRPVGMCADTGLPYTEDGSVLDEIERIKEDRAYEGCF